VTAPAPRRSGGARSAFRRWAAARPFGGRWFALPATLPDDALAEEERARERVRRLSTRYGVLFRELLATELPALAWSKLARSMRALELAGELVAGRFFDGVPGIQFATPAAVGELERGLPEGALYWHGAADPASCCGLDLPGLKPLLPHRRAGSWLVWRGRTLVAIARRGGAELELRVGVGDPGLPDLAAPYRVALTRAVDPERTIEVATINGEPAATSGYLGVFAGFSRTRESGGAIRLRRSYTA
jgi:ATP-dependent Lhr-like helicase